MASDATKSHIFQQLFSIKIMQRYMKHKKSTILSPVIYILTSLL